MFTLIVTRTPGCYLPADRKDKKLPWSLCLLTNLHVPANGYRDLLICCQWWHWHMSNSALGKRQNPQNGSPQFFYFRHPQVMSGLIPELWPGVRAEDNTAWNRSIPHWGNGQRSPWPWQQKNHWSCPDCIDAQCLIPNLQEKCWNCTYRKRSWSCDPLMLSALHQSHLPFAHIDLFGFVFFAGTFMGRWKRRVAMHWNNKFLKAWAGFEISSSLEVVKPCMKVLSKVIN